MCIPFILYWYLIWIDSTFGICVCIKYDLYEYDIYWPHQTQSLIITRITVWSVCGLSCFQRITDWTCSFSQGLWKERRLWFFGKRFPEAHAVDCLGSKTLCEKNTRWVNRPACTSKTLWTRGRQNSVSKNPRICGEVALCWAAKAARQRAPNPGKKGCPKGQIPGRARKRQAGFNRSSVEMEVLWEPGAESGEEKNLRPEELCSWLSKGWICQRQVLVRAVVCPLSVKNCHVAAVFRVVLGRASDFCWLNEA